MIENAKEKLYDNTIGRFKNIFSNFSGRPKDESIKESPAEKFSSIKESPLFVGRNKDNILNVLKTAWEKGYLGSRWWAISKAQWPL